MFWRPTGSPSLVLVLLLINQGMSHSTTPIAISPPAIWYWMTSRPTQGPARKAHSRAATMGSGPGEVKNTSRLGSLLRRGTTQATFTRVKTHSSRNAVVPERFATTLLSGSLVTYQISPSARTVEN